MASDQQDASPKIANDMAAIFRQTNAVMAIEGFEKTPAMESLQAAVLAGRATLNEAEAFVLLEAKIAGTRCTLEASRTKSPQRFGHGRILKSGCAGVRQVERAASVSRGKRQSIANHVGSNGA